MNQLLESTVGFLTHVNGYNNQQSILHTHKPTHRNRNNRQLANIAGP
jgi:hypothetical protein